MYSPCSQHDRPWEVEGLIVPKFIHEFRDPIHTFIQIHTDERRLVDTLPVQRLRRIHQLALTYLVYPGATHVRFEHSLGVMHLAGKVFDTLTNPENLTDEVRELVPEAADSDNHSYWKKVVKLAALLHDVGHIPFSHGAEREVLPQGWSHEDLTLRVVLSDHVTKILDSIRPRPEPRDIAKIAVGPEHYQESFTNWEAILSEVLTGDAFGVDRMDYLLRDSHHAGVAYGKFDHPRLVQTLRILPSPLSEQDLEGDDLPEPALGVEFGGLHAAEALLLARYQIFQQVYFHPVRLAYDAHLQRFLSAYYPDRSYPTDVESHLEQDDFALVTDMKSAKRGTPGTRQQEASRILDREHFQVAYLKNPMDLMLNDDPSAAIERKLKERYGEHAVLRKAPEKSGGSVDFPVRMKDGRCVSSLEASQVLRNAVPIASVDHVFVDRSVREEAQRHIQINRESILQEAST